MAVTRDNKVDIIGKLESVSMEKNFSQEWGNYVRGDLVIAVTKPKAMSIPVNFFVKEITNAGKPRKLYTQLLTLAAGQRINMTGNISDNVFWSTGTGQLVRTKRIGINFINNVRDTDIDKAEFVYSGFVYEPLKEKFDSEQKLLGYTIQLAQANYNNDRCEIITFNVDANNNKAIRYMEQEFRSGKTFRVNGVLDYDIREIIDTKEVDFGDPIVTVYQRNISNLIILGGSAVTEDIYETDTITMLISGDKEYGLAQEEKAKNSDRAGETVTTNKPAPVKGVAESLI